MLRQKSLTMKEEKMEDKSRIQKGSHKLIEEEKAEIGNVSLQGTLQIKAFSRITIVQHTGTSASSIVKHFICKLCH